MRDGWTGKAASTRMRPEPESGQGDMPEQPDEAEELKARLARLQGELEAQRAAEEKTAARREKAEKSAKGFGEAISLGFRVLTEFVSAVAVGAFIGWGLDHWLGTMPFLLVLFVGLGVAAGFKNIYRMAAPKPPRQEGGDPPQA
jgi:ATP synthase protein I